MTKGRIVNMRLGFIGLGNMATAMIGGIIRNCVVEPSDIYGVDVVKAANERAAENLKIQIAGGNCELARTADVIVLSVKPQFYEEVIAEIRNEITRDKCVITIAPGKTLEWLGQQFGKEVKIVRCMPNTPALVGEGCTGVCRNAFVTDDELLRIMTILNSFGKAHSVSEHLMDTVVAVSGSAPAYVFMMIEAMADAAVAEGMARKDAYEFAAQAVYGSAKMVLETGKHPGELKDMVCSPAGTTIEAVRVLEERGFRSGLMEAMRVCAEKSRNL